MLRSVLRLRKTIKRIGFLLFILLLVYMTTQRPTEDQFYTWLKEQHHISCNGTVTCTMELNENHDVSTLIETGSTIKKGYLIFNTVGKTYEDQSGKQLKLKAIGLFGHYYTISKEETSGRKE
jgi:hypothetical protein